MARPALLLASALIAAPAFAQSAPGGAPAPPAFDVAAAREKIDLVLDKAYSHLDALYEDIHAHPEVSFHEVRTSALLAAEMRKLGVTVTEHVGKTGIVAIFKNGDGPTVLVRTEFDALPMEEKTGLPYASHAEQTVNGKLTFVDHSCGA
jgi:metal-dependent amidase/aminoacylase/carboxypeptidase family protein